MKAHHLLLREARRSLAADLTLPQFDVLAHLAREPRGMTSVQLSRRLLVSAGNLTGIVGRLQREGLVSRGAHESDGRATRIRLTAVGQRRMARLAPRHARDIEAVLAPVPRADLETLRELLGRLAGSLESAGRAERRSEVSRGGAGRRPAAKGTAQGHEPAREAERPVAKGGPRSGEAAHRRPRPAARRGVRARARSRSHGEAR